MAALKPTVSWAQRPDMIFVTIQTPDVKDMKLEIEEDKVTFAGESEGKKYEFEFEWQKPVDKESVKMRSNRVVEFVVNKKEEESWTNVSKTKQAYVKIDWNKWVDSDDEGEDFNTEGMQGGPPGGMPGGMPGMGGMGGMPGMGGMGGGMPGMGGMDFSQMMGGMGGMGGAPGGDGGMGGMDMAKLQEMMAGMGGMGGGMPGMGGEEEGEGEGGDSDDDLPDLEGPVGDKAEAAEGEAPAEEVTAA